MYIGGFIFVIFTWGDVPIWLIFFRWVESNHQLDHQRACCTKGLHSIALPGYHSPWFPPPIPKVQRQRVAQRGVAGFLGQLCTGTVRDLGEMKLQHEFSSKFGVRGVPGCPVLKHPLYMFFMHCNRQNRKDPSIVCPPLQKKLRKVQWWMGLYSFSSLWRRFVCWHEEHLGPGTNAFLVVTGKWWFKLFDSKNPNWFPSSRIEMVSIPSKKK